VEQLERKYVKAEEIEKARGARIRKAIDVFVKNHPELYCSEANERILLSAMDAADYLNPTLVSSWEIIYAENREKLQQAPAVRKQSERRVSLASPAPTLTREEIETWSADKIRRECERSDRRAQEIEAALSR
jgi:hypothetical protein